MNGGRNYNGPKVSIASLSKIWLYAGRSEYPALRETFFQGGNALKGHGFSRAVRGGSRDNVTGADNQQERLVGVRVLQKKLLTCNGFG